MKLTTPAHLFSVGLLFSLPATALTIDDSSSALNDRFANNGSFIMDGYDLSGIGISDDADRRWATLLSQNVFVSAFHFFPTNNSTLTFYQTNDPNGASITRTVSDGQRIGSSDIYVGVLDSAVPVGYATYDFATATINDETDFDASIYHDANAFVVGRSPFNSFSGDKDFAVGRNVIDYWGTYNISGTTDDTIMTEREGDLLDVDYEATLVGGDSGAPLLLDVGGSLQVVGTNWWVGQIPSTTIDVNGYTYLGNYSTQIQAYIDANPVPEPSGIAILAAGGLMLIRRRRR